MSVDDTGAPHFTTVKYVHKLWLFLKNGSKHYVKLTPGDHSPHDWLRTHVHKKHRKG